MTQLSDLLKAIKPQGGSIKIRQKYPHKAEVAYRKVLRETILDLAREIKPMVKAEFAGQRNDSVGDLMRSIQSLVSRTLSGEAIAQRVGAEVVAAQDGNISKAISKALGVDILVPGSDLSDMIDVFVLENTALIKSLQDDYLLRVQNTLNQGFRQGLTSGEIAKQINSATGVGLRRAKLIARDQIGSLNAQVSEQRDRDLSINEYIWQHVSDNRVRGKPGGLYEKSKYDHWERGGKKFSYDNPPPDGNPGEPINCRCFSVAVLEW